jgi:hypothetical protein
MDFVEYLMAKPEGGKYLVGLGREGRIILKYIFKIQDKRTWT